MHRDMKVGMALGVALVGIVGALFFRRDPAPQDPPPPPLTDATEIDRQVAEKPRAPYINGLDEFPDAAPAPAPSPVPASPRQDALEVPGFLTSRDEADHKAFLAGQPAAVPDPIATTSPAAPAAGARQTPVPPPQPSPAHNRKWRAESTGGPVDSSGGTQSAAPPVQRTHVTRAGETLSGLAARYLGSSARYRELYEANRNVLRSPDDLPDGVTLVIPETGRRSGDAPAVPASQGRAPGNSAGDSAAVAGAAATGHAPPAHPDSAPRKLKFAPVRRGPLSAGRSSGDDRARQPAPAAGPSADASAQPAAARNAVIPRIELDDSDPFEP